MSSNLGIGRTRQPSYTSKLARAFQALQIIPFHTLKYGLYISHTQRKSRDIQYYLQRSRQTPKHSQSTTSHLPTSISITSTSAINSVTSK